MADEVAVVFDGEESNRKESIANESVGHINEKEIPDDHNQGENGNAESVQKDWKVVILLKPTGNAPILQNKRWRVQATSKIADVIQCIKGEIRKSMKFDTSNSLFLYVNQAFAPCPDDEIGNMYRCFNVNGRLVLHYSTSVAWG